MKKSVLFIMCIVAIFVGAGMFLQKRYVKKRRRESKNADFLYTI